MDGVPCGLVVIMVCKPRTVCKFADLVAQVLNQSLEVLFGHGL